MFLKWSLEVSPGKCSQCDYDTAFLVDQSRSTPTLLTWVLNFFQILTQPPLFPITMAAFSRGLRTFTPSREYVCHRCMQFSTTSVAQSGHSRWSKIKHDKAVVDGKKNVLRSQISREITLCSKRMISSNLKYLRAYLCLSPWRRSEYKLQTGSHTG